MNRESITYSRGFLAKTLQTQFFNSHSRYHSLAWFGYLRFSAAPVHCSTAVAAETRPGPKVHVGASENKVQFASPSEITRQVRVLLHTLVGDSVAGKGKFHGFL